MIRYLIVSIVSGIVFGFLDGVINANPLAQGLLSVYEPILKSSVNIEAGIVIDLFYGFVMAGLFLVLYQGLPGKAGWIKGVFYGFMIWFFRVLMSVATSWMIFKVPNVTHLYVLLTGLGEMVVIGLVYGLTLRPRS
ncbi:hypothetical protein KJ966_18980 [bacterium]|nr:hypothetical protein [bacterium]